MVEKGIHCCIKIYDDDQRIEVGEFAKFQLASTDGEGFELFPFDVFDDGQLLLLVEAVKSAWKNGIDLLHFFIFAEVDQLNEVFSLLQQLSQSFQFDPQPQGIESLEDHPFEMYCYDSAITLLTVRRLTEKLQR